MLNTFDNRMENHLRVIMHILSLGLGLNSNLHSIIIVVIVNLIAVTYGGEVRLGFSSLCFGG